MDWKSLVLSLNKIFPRIFFRVQSLLIYGITNQGNGTDITIGGRHKLYINKDGATDNHYDIQVGPNANINIQIDKGDMNVVLKDGKLNTNVAGDYNMKIGGNMNLDVRGNKTETVSGNKQSNTTGTVIHRGSRIDLNP